MNDRGSISAVRSPFVACVLTLHVKCKLNSLVIIMSVITAMSSFSPQVFQHSKVYHDHPHPTLPSHIITPS